MGTNPSRVKAINSEAQVMAGQVPKVTICIGAWNGKVDLLAVPLDDFELILGVDFFMLAKLR